MRTAAAAIAWEFRQRHRWPLIAMAIYVAGVALYRWVVLGPTTVMIWDGNAALLVVPFSTTFMYFLAVFSFGLSGDLSARASMYPARMFTLPVSTAALAAWPMLYGSVAMTTLWLLGWGLARWWGMDFPLLWPGLLATVFLWWTQVFTWMAYGLNGLRVFVTVAWLMTLDVIVIVAINYKVPQYVLVAFFVPQLPIAYLAACVVVARARRGVVPDWRSARWRAKSVARASLQPRAAFRSPARAQVWFEWRRHGRTLPVLVGLVVPFVLGLLFLPGDATPSIVFATLLAALLMPPFLAGFVAAAVSSANPFARDSYGLPPFIATRPMSSAALIAAKMEMAFWSTLATWLVVLVVIPIALAWSGTMPLVADRARQFTAAVGAPRATGAAALVFAGLIASTWKHLVQNLCIGLSGRDWLIKGSVFVSLLAVILVFPAVRLFTRDGHGIALLWDWCQPALVALVSLKMIGAAWVAIRLGSSGLLADRTLITGAACWMALVFALFGVFVWFADTPLIPHYVLLLIAILQVPLVRLSAAPLALAWNRHR